MLSYFSGVVQTSYSSTEFYGLHTDFFKILRISFRFSEFHAVSSDCIPMHPRCSQFSGVYPKSLDFIIILRDYSDFIPHLLTSSELVRILWTLYSSSDFFGIPCNLPGFFVIMCGFLEHLGVLRTC